MKKRERRERRRKMKKKKREREKKKNEKKEELGKRRGKGPFLWPALLIWKPTWMNCDKTRAQTHLSTWEERPIKLRLSRFFGF